MDTTGRRRRIRAAVALLILAVVAGCGGDAGERREARDRRLRRAYAAREAQDIDGAIRWCEKALARHPDLALAHRELALMHHHYREDYAAAIYHYRRYLELRPDAPQREAVEDLMRHCRVSFAAQMAAAPEEWQRVLQEREERIRVLERELGRAREGQTPAPASAAALPDLPPAAAAPETVHVVQAGENLATISLRYYGTRSKWNVLFDANRDRLTDANNLRVGTTLRIPPE